MSLERLTLLVLIITVVLAGCSAANNPVAPSRGGQADSPDTLNGGPALRNGDRFFSGDAAAILPHGTRLTVRTGRRRRG